MTNGEKLFLTAIKYIGIKESQTGWNDQIKKWIFASCESLGLQKPKDDSEFAWCACFITNIMIEAGLWSYGKHIVSARKFLEIGTPVDEPQFGDIVILERGPGKGHIGIYINNINEGKLKLLSGNSMDSVSIADYYRKRKLGFRRI